MNGNIMRFEDISLNVAGGVGRITVMRADRLNSMRSQTVAEIRIAVQCLEKNDDVKSVILTGDGRAFGAGYDLTTLPTEGTLPLDRVLDDYVNPLIRCIRQSRLQIISAVNGPCAGASVGIALSCDIVLAASTAYFYSPFVSIGLVPDAGCSLFMTNSIGRVRASASMLLGERISANEALAWGLVWRVLEDSEALMAFADKCATRLAGLSGFAVAATKRLIAAASNEHVDNQLKMERDLQIKASHTPEMQAGLAEFRKLRAR